MSVGISLVFQTRVWKEAVRAAGSHRGRIGQGSKVMTTRRYVMKCWSHGDYPLSSELTCSGVKLGCFGCEDVGTDIGLCHPTWEPIVLSNCLALTLLFVWSSHLVCPSLLCFHRMNFNFAARRVSFVLED